MTTSTVTHAEAQRDVMILGRLPASLHSLPASNNERLAMNEGLDRMMSLGYITWTFAQSQVDITPAGEAVYCRAMEAGWDDKGLINALLIYPESMRERRAS